MEAQLVQQLDYESFIPKLGQWAQLFKPFIQSREMWDIYQEIKKDAIKERIVPDSKDTFRAFSTSLPTDIRAIFYLMDPYPRLYKGTDIPQADGIAMSCSHSPDGKLQPSLEIFYNAIDAELATEVSRCPDLAYLHEQGVLLLNTDLTCKLNKTQSHERLWEPFQKFLLQDILRSRADIIYVLCGKASQRMEGLINPFCNIFELEHPAAAAHKRTEWDSQGIFLKINRLLKESKRGHIFWDSKDWEAYKEPPF